MWDCLTRSLRSWVAVSQASRSAAVHTRWGSSSRSARLTWGRVIWGIFFPPVLLHLHQEGTGQQGEGDVMVPAGPAAHLIFIQAGLALLRLQLGLHHPAG